MFVSSSSFMKTNHLPNISLIIRRFEGLKALAKKNIF